MLNIALITRARRSAVAYEVAQNINKRSRGRPKVYGEKIHLYSLFDSEELKEEEVTLYGKKEKVKVWKRHLIWKNFTDTTNTDTATETSALYVGVLRADGSRAVFISTDKDLTTKTVIEMYSARFSIETAFQAGIDSTHEGSYRGWVKEDISVRKGINNHHTHRMNKKDRAKFYSKLRSYHLHAFCSGVAQGLLQIKSLREGQSLWTQMPGWIRTIRPNLEPSEAVVKSIIKKEYYEFLALVKLKNMHKNILAKLIFRWRYEQQGKNNSEKKAA